jgi:UDP-glucose 4-epimerase
MNILVTGGNGYLGSKICQHLYNNGHDVTSLIRSKVYYSEAEVNKIKIVNWDDFDSIKEALTNIEIVIHAAGMNHINCEKDPRGALKFNGISTLDLINASILMGVKKIIYLSTLHVYSSNLEGVIDEKSRLFNLHPYATSHNAGENCVLYAAKNNCIDGVVLRLSNVFGKPTSKHINCWNLLINDLCKQAVENNKILLKSDGMQQRDFLPITNMCNVIDKLIEIKSYNKFNSLINLGSGETYKIIDMAKLVKERFEYLFGVKISIDVDESNKANSSDFKYSTNYSHEIDKYKTITIKNEIDSLLNYCVSTFS